jgi:putative transposase
MSEVIQSLSHSQWDCKYHVVIVPNRRRKELFGHLRPQLGPLFHELARQFEAALPIKPPASPEVSDLEVFRRKT